MTRVLGSHIRTVDLRSDLCTLPTDEMWSAMRAAALGWATYGEDPSVNRLLEIAAGALGKEAAIWIPTCAMANLVALLTLAPRGSRFVLETSSHILTRESIEDVAGLQPVPIDSVDGRLSLESVEHALDETGAAALVLENTHTRAGGTIIGAHHTAELAAAAHDRGAAVHLDGARLANAAVALSLPLAELARPVDTVALSLNKGLSAPMGTVLAGSAAAIAQARGHLASLGGATIHRAGIPAAAGIVALETMIDRLADDHSRARMLAQLLARVPGVVLDPSAVETNIVLVDVSGTGFSARDLSDRLAGSGVLAMVRDERRIRFVTHRLIDDDDVVFAAAAVAAIAA